MIGNISFWEWPGLLKWLPHTWSTITKSAFCLTYVPKSFTLWFLTCDSIDDIFRYAVHTVSDVKNFICFVEFVGLKTKGVT